MIKDVNLKPFTKSEMFPAYVYKKGLTIYTLNAMVADGYEITLAKLTVGESTSDSELLCHALFESYNDHGEKMVETRARMSGSEREFNAGKEAMIKAGIEFEPITPCHFDELMSELGAWYEAANPDIRECKVMSQKCH